VVARAADPGDLHESALRAVYDALPARGARAEVAGAAGDRRIDPGDHAPGEWSFHS
jgi:hypothetical protein